MSSSSAPGRLGSRRPRTCLTRGRRVIVLEARDRGGGRIWASTLPGTDVLVEWGGTWVIPEGQATVAAAIARSGLVPGSCASRPRTLFHQRVRAFAGSDIARVGVGWMEGALASGRAAAAQAERELAASG